MSDKVPSDTPVKPRRRRRSPTPAEPEFKQSTIPRNPAAMPYVTVAPGGRYFMTEDGEPFLVIGHNDAMPWPRMWNMHHDQDIATTEAYIRMLAEHGVTVMRIMLEYCQDTHWYFEKPVGKPLPEAVLYWDNLVGLCEKYGVRLLVLFWDTFFMYRRWKRHPYSRAGSGFDRQASFCVLPSAIAAQKQRIRFFVERWGNSGAIFGYDLFNEIEAAWGGSVEQQWNWIAEMSAFVRECELSLWGKRHLTTVSCFGHIAKPEYRELIYNHPDLDFASTHVYIYGLVDKPNNTIDCIFPMRDAVLTAYEHIRGARPYTDSEHGPIHLFLDHKKQLPESFDDEYFHNMTWAHLAAGGAGGGLRWPFRNPHCLTPGMHDIQAALARFTPALDWPRFSPRPIDHALRVLPRGQATLEGATAVPILALGCADDNQALVWLVRDVRAVAVDEQLPAADLSIDGLQPGSYAVALWDTYAGEQTGSCSFEVGEDRQARLALPRIGRDLAIAILRR